MPPDPAKSSYEHLTKEGREAVVGRLIEDVAAVYFSSEVGSRMAEGLRMTLQSGEFDNIENPAQLAEKLTELLRRWGNNDKHLEVGFVGAPLQLSRQEDALPATGSAPLPGCFVEAEKGEDEIGYLKLNSFESVVASAHASESEKFEARQNKRTLEDALTKLAGARSVIIDLRENGGGDPRSGAGSNCR